MSAFTRFLGRVFGSEKPADAPTDKPNDKPAEKPGRTRGTGRAARYDAADDLDEYSRKHWLAADGLSANAANSPDVRYKLRTRSRYERANNGYYKGLVRARTNDTVGTGPRLQLDFPEAVYDADFQRTVAATPPGTTPADLARAVERLWCEWCESVRLTDKMRVMADAEDVDGETFALFVTRDTDFPVKLGLREVECDRVTNPELFPETDRHLDGIRFDAAGNPVSYDVLRRHPGDDGPLSNPARPDEFDRVPAAQVVHLFEQDRPEQCRGVPILAPALPLFSMLRRHTLAELGAAELGAMIAGVIENDNAIPDGSDADAPEWEAMDQVPFARNMLLTLAGGQKAKTFEGKQPAPGGNEFHARVLTEAGRAAGEMKNTATGSSADYNYSSGRLDHLPRQRGIEIRRDRWELNFLDRAFLAWYAEASLVPGYLPEGLPAPAAWNWAWQWDGFPSIDPLKDAKAQEVRKKIGLTTDADELAREGKDWREHYKQLAREKAERKRLGIEPPPEGAPGPATADEVADEVEDRSSETRGGVR